MQSTWWAPEVDEDASRLIAVSLQSYACIQGLVGVIEALVDTRSTPFWPSAANPNSNIFTIVVVPLLVFVAAKLLQRLPSRVYGGALIVLLTSGAAAVAAVSIHANDASIVPAVTYLLITVSMAYLWPRRQTVVLSMYVCIVIFINAYLTTAESTPLVRGVMLSLVVAGASWGIASARDRQRRDMALLEAAGRHDSLTGLHIRREADAAIADAVHDPFPTAGHSLILIDINGFKKVNDSQGHPFGDAVLRQLGAHLLALASDDDVPFRLGGDELGVFLRGTSEEEAKAFAEELQHRLAATPLLTPTGENVVTRISYGCAHASTPGEIAALYTTCDRNLYTAKRKVKEGNQRSVDPQLRFFVDAAPLNTAEVP